VPHFNPNKADQYWIYLNQRNGRLKADLFMSKLTSRLPNLVILVVRLTFVVFIHRKTNQSLQTRELNLIHITMP